ncbi:glycosyltransferase [Natrinema saccharevitans]|uniref:glycosyltransferase n=1 Tax=Natrinema saccharevitans TaxID=301967 RepID=UPI0009701484|nr:glycosyltransferase [Natrinema saccharevitans]
MSGIVFVTVADLSKTTGSGVATREIIRGISAVSDESLVVLCPEPKEEVPERLKESVDKFVLLPARTNPGSPYWHLKVEFSILRKLWQLLREEDPSLLVTRLSPSTIFPAPLCRIFDISHVLLIRGWVRRFDERGETKFGRLIEQIVKMNVRNSSHVYVAFDELKEWVDSYRDESQSSVKVLPNAVDPNLFSPKPLEESRSEVRINTDKFVIGFVGSLAPRHELSTLFKAAARIDNVYLLIVGDGTLRDNLEQFATDLGITNRVTFTGRVDHENVPKYIAAFDAGYGVVSPGKASNPIKCYEYLSCERPVITSQKEEFEFVREIDAGVVVDSVSVDEVQVAIERLQTQSRDERRDAGRVGRSYVCKNFTWKGMAKGILESVVDKK